MPIDVGHVGTSDDTEGELQSIWVSAEEMSIEVRRAVHVHAVESHSHHFFRAIATGQLKVFPIPADAPDGVTIGAAIQASPGIPCT